MGGWWLRGGVVEGGGGGDTVGCYYGMWLSVNIAIKANKTKT